MKVHKHLNYFPSTRWTMSNRENWLVEIDKTPQFESDCVDSAELNNVIKQFANAGNKPRVCARPQSIIGVSIR